MRRKIIKIDEALCNGCGQCILDCAEGALKIVDGKAKVISDNLCDGLGACLQGCPQGALAIIERDAEAFDEAAVRLLSQKLKASSGSGCSGMQKFSLEPLPGAEKHWPLKVRLVSPGAPFLHGAQIVIAADCAAAASPTFHTITEGRRVLIACPKFEPREMLQEKIRDIVRQANPRSINVLRMEVPCCAGLLQACRDAADESGLSLEVTDSVMRCEGEIAKGS